MLHKRKQLPKYCHHKPSDRAFVRIGEKMYYLGKYGSDASRREYDRLIGEFIASGRQSFHDQDEILLESLIVQYLNYIEKEVDLCEERKASINRILRALNELYGKQPVSSFGPMALKAFRHRWVEKGLCLATINNYTNVVKQFFCWGSEEEIVPPEIAGALRMVRQLQKGRTSATVYDAIEPVADETVEKTLPHLRQEIQDMVRVQRFLSGRPQDICNMRLCDIDMSGEIWTYTPFRQSNRWGCFFQKFL